MLKSYRVGGGGGPCDYCVSPSPFDLDFATLDFGTSDSGLTIGEKFYVQCVSFSFNHLTYPLTTDVQINHKLSNSLEAPSF